MLHLTSFKGWKAAVKSTSSPRTPMRSSYVHQKKRRYASIAAPKALFPEDEIKQSGPGFLRSLGIFARDLEYNMKQSSLSHRIHNLEPQVRALMAREDMETFTKEERDSVAEWISLNQNYHTYRRRKFMSDSADRIAEMSAPQRSAWDVARDELVSASQKHDAVLYPGGDRGHLWSQEAKYMAAETYSRDNMRFAMLERSLDANSVGAAPQRLFHLEPAMPPSYQASAAMALKNEGKALDRTSHDRLQQLIAKRKMEFPLEATLALNPQLPERLQSLLDYMGVPPPAPNKMPSADSSQQGPLSNSGQEPPHDPTPNTIIDRLRAWFAKNGPLGVALYLSYSMIDLTLIYIIISTGVDISSLLALVGLTKGAGAATFAVAYALHKMLAPPRAALVVLTLPYAKPHWDRMIHVLETKLVSRETENQAKIDHQDPPRL